MMGSPTGLQTRKTNVIKVHTILEGPFTIDDFEDEDDWDGPTYESVFLLVKIEKSDGTLEDVEWYFDNLDQSYVWVRYFNTYIEPLVIEVNQ